ncbi:hypothetical protein RQP46_006772 [Phenoliferia psychrophenolica]
MGVGNPLPVPLAAECRKAAKLFSAFADPVNGLDKVIPAAVLRKAKGFCMLTVVKAGFVFSARAGSGVVIARLPNGDWSAPSAVGTAGAGFGMQVGAEMTEFFIILNSRAAVNSFMAAGSLTLGGNMSVAAGPLGRNVEGTGTLSSKGGLAAMYSYSRTKGLFGGASVEGSVIVERSDANLKAYGHSVTAKQLLSGAVGVPEWAEYLIDTIARRSGNATNWVGEDDEDIGRPAPNAGYAFGSQYAAGGAAETKSGSGFKIGNIGLPGRSRAGSTATNKSGGGGGGPTYSGGGAKFDQDFGDAYAQKERKDVEWGQGDEERSRARSASASSAGRGWGGGKLTKARSGSGSGRDATAYRSSPVATTGRDSFDSLDDDDRGSYGSSPRLGRGSSNNRQNNNHHLSSDDDNDNFSSPARKPPAPVRFPASSLRGTPPPSSSSSPFADSASPSPRHFTSSPSSSRPSASSKKSFSTAKPWDSEDESLMDFNGPSPSRFGGSPPSLSTNGNGNGNTDAFDFSQVDVDFSLGQRDGRANLVSSPVRARSRASTGGKGLGSAIAKFDFASNEPGDLPFKKGDVITVLKQEDAEWWTGRIAIRIFPRNYCDFIPN